MKIPNGAAAVSAEDARNGFDFAKPSTANFRGKERAFPVMRKSEDLLGLSSANGEFGIITERLLHRNGCGDFLKSLQPYFFEKLRGFKLCLLKSIFSKSQACCLL